MNRAPSRACALRCVLSLSLALAACAPPPVSLAHVDRAYRPDDYDAALRRWTRSTELLVLQGLDQRIDVAATFLSWDFRHALLARFAEDATLSAQDRVRELESLRAGALREHEFFVALVTTQQRYGMLHRPTSAWRMHLVDDRGREVSPTRIEPVRRASASEQRYFPYVSPWRQLFRVRFPVRALAPDGTEYDVLGEGTRRFTLRFSGALGTADLRWEVAPGG